MADEGSDDDDDGQSILANSKTKNRASKEITKLKIIIAVLAWEECSTKSGTTDIKGLDELMYQKILNWLALLSSDYGNIVLHYIKSDRSTGTNKQKSDKLMADLALAFPVIPPPVKPGVSGAYVRLGKKSCADIHKYLSPSWCDPSNAAKVKVVYT